MKDRLKSSEQQYIISSDVKKTSIRHAKDKFFAEQPLSILEPAFIVTPQQVEVIRPQKYADARSPDKLWRNSYNSRTNNANNTREDGVLSPTV